MLVRDIPNGGVVSPASSPSTTPSTGPGGVPRYYVALAPADGNPSSPNVQNVIVVGDALTGKKLATFTPPAGVLKFLSVTGAADDRTFVVAALALSGTAASAEWFSVRLAPGTAHPASMTPLPVKPQPVPTDRTQPPHAGLVSAFPTALSASGQELAVAEMTDAGGLAVKVFSLATGQLQHEWTTNDQSLSVTGLAVAPALTWIDGDRALAVTTLSYVAQSGPASKEHEVVRRLNVDGATGGDLVASSTVLRNTEAEGHSNWESSCGDHYDWPPVVGASGTTFTCSALGSLPYLPSGGGPARRGQNRQPALNRDDPGHEGRLHERRAVDQRVR